MLVGGLVLPHLILPPPLPSISRKRSRERKERKQKTFLTTVGGKWGTARTLSSLLSSNLESLCTFWPLPSDSSLGVVVALPVISQAEEGMESPWVPSV